MGQRHTILAVLAHPDDETFGMGGTLALYARQGAAVYLICATRGEAGEVDPEYLRGFSSVAERREQELRCAAEKLGLAGVYFLGYRDSGMPGSLDNQNSQALINAPLESVAAQIVALIRELRPEVVLTFDPIGGYRHPDHIAIHKAAVLAFEKAGDPGFAPGSQAAYAPRKLYFHTIPRGFLRWAVYLLPLFGIDPRHWGRNRDIDLASLAKDNFPVHAVIDFSPVQQVKVEASNCHASQGGPQMAKGIMGWILRRGSTRESFMRAYPAPANGRKERDLFEGLE